MWVMGRKDNRQSEIIKTVPCNYGGFVHRRDVYKRQEYSVVKMVSLGVSANCPRNAKLTQPSGMTSGRSPFLPVSYTHLDVYKRQSLKKLLLKKPLDKITINDLTTDCGISRMAFYYDFKDIYLSLIRISMAVVMDFGSSVTYIL